MLFDTVIMWVKLVHRFNNLYDATDTIRHDLFLHYATSMENGQLQMIVMKLESQ